MRLIDSDALIADCNLFNAWDAQIVKAWLDDQPTVDAVPVRHGKWTRHRTSPKGSNYSCSQCGKVAMTKFKWCPNCGADMRGGNSEHE